MTKFTVFASGYSRSGLADPFGDLGGSPKNYPEGVIDANIVEGKGIYVFNMSSDDLTFSTASVVTGPPEPSFLAIDTQHNRVFAVNECNEFEGHKGGAITAFKLNLAGPELLHLVDSVPAGGFDPCMITTDHTGAFVCVANYSSGDVTIWTVREDGGLGERTAFVKFEGSGPTSRQLSPHAHAVLFAPSNKFIFITDLGTDKIHRLTFDEHTGAAALTDGGASVVAGSGPRSIALHPNKKWIYTTNEMESRLDIFQLNDDETLHVLGSVNMLPAGWPHDSDSGKRWAQHNGGRWAAHVDVSPNGKFVYASNRLHDSIAVFKVTDSGLLETVTHTPSHGAVPRHFSLTADGSTLLVANQVSSNVAAFKIDQATGVPEFVRSVVVPFPSFVQALAL